MDAPPPCTDGSTKAITAEDTVRENPVIRDGVVPSSPTSTLPANEQWVEELFGSLSIGGLDPLVPREKFVSGTQALTDHMSELGFSWKVA